MILLQSFGKVIIVSLKYLRYLELYFFVLIHIFLLTNLHFSCCCSDLDETSMLYSSSTIAISALLYSMTIHSMIPDKWIHELPRACLPVSDNYLHVQSKELHPSSKLFEIQECIDRLKSIIFLIPSTLSNSEPSTTICTPDGQVGCCYLFNFAQEYLMRFIKLFRILSALVIRSSLLLHPCWLVANAAEIAHLPVAHQRKESLLRVNMTNCNLGWIKKF